MNDGFIIPLNGLAAGKHGFVVCAGKEFFNSFGNGEILDADLCVRVEVEKSGRYVGVDCDIEGVLTVECDRCLGLLDMPVCTHVDLTVKFGKEDASEIGGEGGREVIFVPEDDSRLDLSQIIYDYACLTLPMQRMHAAGGCDPDAMRYYGTSDRHDVFGEEEAENPFAALKNMFK